MVAIHLLLHDTAGALASLLYKAEKPSVCPFAFILGFCVESISAVPASINVKLARNEVPVFCDDEVSF